MKKTKKITQFLCLGLITGGFYACDFTEDQIPLIEDDAKVLFATVSPKSNFIFFDDFNSGNSPLSMAHSHELGGNHSLTSVTKPNYPNEKAARFELRDNDPLVKGSIRAEVTIVKGDEGHIEKDTWYGFDLFVPEDYADEDDTESINQWFHDGPAALINIRNGKLFWRFYINGNKTDIQLGALKKGQWSNFVIHMVHSYESDGVTELWLDGKKLIDERGRNINSSGGIPKWKIGIYKWEWADSKTTVSKRVLLFDNVRVGDSKTTYEDMAYDFSSGNAENNDQTANPGGDSSDNDDSSDEGTSNGDSSEENDEENNGGTSNGDDDDENDGGTSNRDDVDQISEEVEEDRSRRRGNRRNRRR
ncbi:polysaccharide lyase [Lunatibacter salilacus]|uniref:polysaccharide lyase n=1 Tax=Lunatibacter salilacus TaxID=2483804 RepID=UPI00131A77AF|nr:polysaccharide lyase [Lunatibacter salilacus]